MDWDLAIARNREALQGIVAGLIAMARIAMGAPAATLPRVLRNAILRLLRPAESAARRLIVIAARGVAGPSPLVGEGGCARPQDGSRRMRGSYAPSLSPSSGPSGHLLPQGEKEETAPRVPAFVLVDPRKRFAWLKPNTVPGFGPRISLPGVSDPVFRPPPDPDAPVPCARLLARLAALDAALADLPRQALRLARWRARAAVLPGPEPSRRRVAKGVRLLPIRVGRPPGRRRRGRDEVDAILAECHALALDALGGHDTS